MLEPRADSGEHSYHFRLGSYDPTRELVVDPVNLVYCGYIGGSGPDALDEVAVDADGNAYVAGHTQSTEATFPVWMGPDLTFNGGTWDAFVAKIPAFLFGDGFESGDTTAWSLTVP